MRAVYAAPLFQRHQLFGVARLEAADIVAEQVVLATERHCTHGTCQPNVSFAAELRAALAERAVVDVEAAFQAPPRSSEPIKPQRSPCRLPEPNSYWRLPFEFELNTKPLSRSP